MPMIETCCPGDDAQAREANKAAEAAKKAFDEAAAAVKGKAKAEEGELSKAGP